MASSPRVTRSAAVALAVLLIVSLAAEVAFAAAHWEYYSSRGIATTEHFLYILVLGGLGVLIAHRRPDNPIGWLLVAVAMLRQVSALQSVVDVSLTEGADVTWVHILARGLWPSGFTFALLALAIMLFPTGRLPSSRLRPVVWLVGVMAVIDVVAFNLYPALDARRTIAASEVTTPLVPVVGWGPVSLDRHVRPLPELNVVQAVFIALLLALLTLSMVSLVHHWRRGSGEERQQVKWLMPALVLWVVGLVVSVLPFGLPLDVLPLMVLPLPICMATAILWHRAFDIDRIVSQALVYGVLSVGIFAVYALVAAGLGIAAQARFPVEVAIAVTAVLAFAFQPARRSLQQLADRWVFGDRLTPLEAVADLEADPDDASTTDLAAQLAATIQSTGRLRWTSVVVPHSPMRTCGERTDDVALVVDIEHAGERLGRIECGPKLRGRFTAADGNLLRALASHTALVLSNARLASRLVQAQEAERRRIERNIHDGAQQELVALIAKLTIARNDLRHDRLDEATLEDLQHDAGHILTDLRTLAQGIHPTVLTDGGLVEAVEDRCKRLPLDVVIDVAPGLRRRRFDDDVEGASYFFVTEGLTNVLKHAAATTAHIDIQPMDWHLQLRISDDGNGCTPGSVAQHGLAGLSDRFRALGGRVSFTSQPGTGTVLEGWLPLEPS